MAERKTLEFDFKTVAAKSNFRCWYCDVKVGRSGQPMHRDHRIPVSRGGTDDLDNLVIACAKCNLSKSTMTDKEFFWFNGLDPYIRHRWQWFQGLTPEEKRLYASLYEDMFEVFEVD
jgi:5-methylcytosine-specific restriction endonuclease McrA